MLLGARSHCAWVRRALTERPRHVPLRVVLIDEDRTFTAIYKRLLEVADIEVLIADDGQAGLELVAAVLPDVVVLDLALTDMSGLDVLAGLKAVESTRHIAVGILDANSSKSTMMLCHALGAIGYLAKTLISPKMLARLLRAWAAESRTPDC